jgi:MFS family permease
MLHALFMFITSTVLPTVVTEIGGIAYYAWATTFFAVSSIVGAVTTLPFIAKLTPRGAYLFGILLFIFGSSACAAASDMAMFIIGRAFQGLGGGLMSGMAFAMIPVVFPDALRSRALALISSVWGPAALTGPLLGGAFGASSLWRTVFWTSVPIASFLAMLACTVLPTRSLTIDPGGGLSKALGTRLMLVTMAALALSVSGVPGRVSVSSVGVGGALACLYTAIRLDGRTSHQIFLSGGFDLGTPMGPITYTMILLVLGVGTTSFIPYILRVGYGASPLVGGYVAALSSLAWTLASLSTAGVGVAVRRRLIALAPLVSAAGMLGVAEGLSKSNLPLTAVSWAMFGGGVGMTWPHLASLLVALSPEPKREAAGAFVTLLQIGAAAFGAAFAGMAANITGLPNATTRAEVTIAAFGLFATFAVAPLVATFTASRVLRHENSYLSD